MESPTTRTVTFPHDMYERIKTAAAADHRTVAGEILALLEEALKARAADREAA